MLRRMSSRIRGNHSLQSMQHIRALTANSVHNAQMFNTESPPELASSLGERLRTLRLQRNITQAQLAADAGVARPTLSRFERTGVGSVDTLVRVLFALGRESELKELLQKDPPSTLDEVVMPPQRQRASKSA